MVEEIYSTQAPTLPLDPNDSSELVARVMTHNCQLVTVGAGSMGYDSELPASYHLG